jgi:hypothetical protein
MARNRPTVVFVMAVLNIVFGTLGFFFACCGGGSMLFLQYTPIPAPWNPKESLYKPMTDVLDAEAPNHLAIQLGVSGTEMLLVALLIVGGIGLIGMRRWGRALVIIASAAGMIVLTGSFIWSIIVLNPAMHHANAAFMESMQKNMAGQNAPMPNMEFKMSETMETAIPAVIYGVKMLYCLIALVTMLLPSVSRAFAGAGTAEAPPEDYHDPRAGQND